MVANRVNEEGNGTTVRIRKRQTAVRHVSTEEAVIDGTEPSAAPRGRQKHRNDVAACKRQEVDETSRHARGRAPTDGFVEHTNAACRDGRRKAQRQLMPGTRNQVGVDLDAHHAGAPSGSFSKHDTVTRSEIDEEVLRTNVEYVHDRAH